MSSNKFDGRPYPLRRIFVLLLMCGSIIGYFLIVPTVFNSQLAKWGGAESSDLELSHRVPFNDQAGSSKEPSVAVLSDSSSVAKDALPSGPSQLEGSTLGSDTASISNAESFTQLAHDTRAALAPSRIDSETPEDSEPYVGLIQSKARPLGLEIIAPVEADPQDEAYMEFLDNGLAVVMEYLDGVYHERAEIDSNTEDLDLRDMVLQQDSDVRVYFLKEGTIFRNTLGIDMASDQRIIFPNASSAHSYYKDADTRNEYTTEDIPLVPGDYVDLGRMPAGSLIDLFLIQDGARNENGSIFWGDAESNEDQTNHAKLMAIYNENTYIIGFEDIPGGGDRDYNDLVIAVEVKSDR